MLEFLIKVVTSYILSMVLCVIFGLAPEEKEEFKDFALFMIFVTIVVQLIFSA